MPSPRPKNGLTLIEMLVAMTASLILFGAVVTILQILGDAVAKSRRTGRLESDLCAVRTRLKLDLAGTTANRNAEGLQAEPDSGSVSGYFEVVEGPNSDLIDFSTPVPFDRSVATPGPTADSDDRIVGDTDDMLFFTTRNVTLDPFVGRYGNETISGNAAEVAYFCRRTEGTSNPKLYTLYRRQLLIIGGSPRPPFSSNGSMQVKTWTDFYANYDLSARREVVNGNTSFVLNTANDLQRRKNRFAHDPASNGMTSDISRLDPFHANNVLVFTGSRKNEDVLATNVLAFDVRLLDPQAVERQDVNTLPMTFPMQPGDKDYWTTNNNLAAATPVYGDLGFNAFAVFHKGTAAPGVFGGYGRAGHALVGSPTSSRTYDTWTKFYQTNGQDDDGNNVIDDAAERAPYSEPLQSVRIVIRLYDAETKTVKQATITESFTN